MAFVTTRYNDCNPEGALAQYHASLQIKNEYYPYESFDDYLVSEFGGMPLYAVFGEDDEEDDEDEDLELDPDPKRMSMSEYAYAVGAPMELF